MYLLKNELKFLFITGGDITWPVSFGNPVLRMPEFIAGHKTYSSRAA